MLFANRSPTYNLNLIIQTFIFYNYSMETPKILFIALLLVLTSTRKLQEEASPADTAIVVDQNLIDRFRTTIESVKSQLREGRSLQDLRDIAQGLRDIKQYIDLILTAFQKQRQQLGDDIPQDNTIIFGNLELKDLTPQTGRFNVGFLLHTTLEGKGSTCVGLLGFFRIDFSQLDEIQTNPSLVVSLHQQREVNEVVKQLILETPAHQEIFL